MSIATMDSYHTAAGMDSVISSAAATVGEEDESAFVQPRVHRFTLLKPGAKPKRLSTSASGNGDGAFAGSVGLGQSGAVNGGGGSGIGMWNPLEIFFSSGLLVSRCEMCAKRIGWRPFLECDDCGVR